MRDISDRLSEFRETIWKGWLSFERQCSLFILAPFQEKTILACVHVLACLCHSVSRDGLKASKGKT